MSGSPDPSAAEHDGEDNGHWYTSPVLLFIPVALLRKQASICSLVKEMRDECTLSHALLSGCIVDTLSPPG